MISEIFINYVMVKTITFLQRAGIYLHSIFISALNAEIKIGEFMKKVFITILVLTSFSTMANVNCRAIKNNQVVSFENHADSELESVTRYKAEIEGITFSVDKFVNGPTGTQLSVQIADGDRAFFNGSGGTLVSSRLGATIICR